MYWFTDHCSPDLLSSHLCALGQLKALQERYLQSWNTTYICGFEHYRKGVMLMIYANW
jgi:hypothetical protein